MIGVDAGSTFSDFVYRDFDDGLIAVDKIGNSPDEISPRVSEGPGIALSLRLDLE